VIRKTCSSGFAFLVVYPKQLRYHCCKFSTISFKNIIIFFFFIITEYSNISSSPSQSRIKYILMRISDIKWYIMKSFEFVTIFVLVVGEVVRSVCILFELFAIKLRILVLNQVYESSLDLGVIFNFHQKLITITTGSSIELPAKL